MDETTAAAITAAVHLNTDQAAVYFNVACFLSLSLARSETTVWEWKLRRFIASYMNVAKSRLSMHLYRTEIITFKLVG